MTQPKPLPSPLSHLGDIGVERFLAEYWQKLPLLIRQAFGVEMPVLAPETLAGFALEEDVESRLIVETPTGDSFASDWRVAHGPLREQDFAGLPESHWTLLVQAVDQCAPEVGQLLNCFRFLPNWRIDDIMVSYASDGGSVGPHFDYYDVFLLQAHGRRRWRLGQMCDSNSPLRTDVPMKILTEFETSADYQLEPGDMLYIPPGVAHWGTAQGECTTYSIGFRAPSYADVLLDFSEEIAGQLSPDRRYSDAGDPPVRHPGEISPKAVVRLREILRELISDDRRIAEWLAGYGTRTQRQAPEPEGLPAANGDSLAVVLKQRVRSTYVPLADARAQVYVNDQPFACSLALARALSGYQAFAPADFTSSEDRALLQELLSVEWLLDAE